MDKVLPWSIQLSKYKYQKGAFPFIFQFALTGILFFEKVKEAKLPFTLYKENLTPLVTEILNFFDKFLQLRQDFVSFLNQSQVCDTF